MTESAARSLPDDAGPSVPAGIDPGERGRLTIEDRVVERVAGYAATQVEGVYAAPHRMLGITFGESRPDDEASVKAHVDGRLATVQARIAVEWPHSVPVAADRLRQRVRDDVARLTDVRVTHIDIDVVALPSRVAARRRVE